MLLQHIMIYLLPLHSCPGGIGTSVRTGYGIHNLLSLLLNFFIRLRLAAVHRCVPYICGMTERHIIDSSVTGRQLTILFQRRISGVIHRGPFRGNLIHLTAGLFLTGLLITDYDCIIFKNTYVQTLQIIRHSHRKKTV